MSGPSEVRKALNWGANGSAAFSVADRGYVMETGHIVREGAVADLREDPAVRDAYLGID